MYKKVTRTLFKNTNLSVSTPIFDENKKMFNENDQRRRIQNYKKELNNNEEDITEIILQYNNQCKLDLTETKKYLFRTEIKPNFCSYINEAYIDIYVKISDADVNKTIAQHWQYLILDKLNITFNNIELASVPGSSLISLLCEFNKDLLPTDSIRENNKTQKIMRKRSLLPLSCNSFNKQPNFISKEDKLLIECQFNELNKATATKIYYHQ